MARDQYKLTFPVLADPLKQTTALINGAAATGLPVVLLIDSNFVIQYHYSGGKPPDLKEQLDAFLPP